MKVILAGGSGQVGTMLARAFAKDNAEVVVLSRSAGKRSAGVPWRMVYWDGQHAGSWVGELEGAAAVINLAGRSVNCRYSSKNKQAMMASRLESTRAIGEALRQLQFPPPVWLQASTATIYSHRYDLGNDERNGVLGGGEPHAPRHWDFSIEIAKAWEAGAREAVPDGVRLVLMRSAMTMSPDRGGVFDTLLGLVRRGLGGRAGDGRQYVSWIHEDDFVRAVQWLMAHPDIEGPINLAAPNPLPNADFMRALRQAAGKRLGLPATKWMLEIGAVFLRTETELILKSRRVVPGRLLNEEFDFTFPTWPAAAQDLVQRWSAARQTR